MQNRLLAFMAALIVATGCAPSIAATGTAVGVNPSATAETKGDVRTLVVGADVNVGDKVVTGAQGQVQLIFADKTKLVVGPGSALVIEDYLLRNEASASKFAVNALAGTFRFVTGQSPKDAYEIKTPTGTIGVRGTGFDFTVTPSTTSVILFHGAVQICSKSGECVVLTDKCDVGVYDSALSQVIGQDQKYDDVWRDQFPYARNESPLDRKFWIADARKCLLTPDRGNGGKSLADPPPPPEDDYGYNPGFVKP